LVDKNKFKVLASLGKVISQYEHGLSIATYSSGPTFGSNFGKYFKSFPYFLNPVSPFVAILSIRFGWTRLFKCYIHGSRHKMQFQTLHVV